MRAKLIVIEHVDEVVAQLRLLAEVLGPVMRRLERVAVVMAPDVDPRAGVPVLPPGTARSLVFLDDDEGKAGLRQADPGEDAGWDRVWDGAGAGDLTGLKDELAACVARTDLDSIVTQASSTWSGSASTSTRPL